MQCKMQLLVVNHNILMTYTLWVEEGLEWSHNPMTNKTTCSNNTEFQSCACTAWENFQWTILTTLASGVDNLYGTVSELCMHCMGKLFWTVLST